MLSQLFLLGLSQKIETTILIFAICITALLLWFRLRDFWVCLSYTFEVLYYALFLCRLIQFVLVIVILSAIVLAVLGINSLITKLSFSLTS